MEKGLLEKTGKSLEEWVKVVRKTGLEKHGEIVAHLKKEHGFTHGYANMVALKAREAGADDFAPEDLIASQYSRGKEGLKPIYDLLKEKISSLGKDIEFVPKKANVSVRRKKQFALIQPSTKTRIDLGLKIRNKEEKGRLENSGPFGSMCSHRVQLTGIKDVDNEVIQWLREAYEQAD